MIINKQECPRYVMAKGYIIHPNELIKRGVDVYWYIAKGSEMFVIPAGCYHFEFCTRASTCEAINYRPMSMQALKDIKQCIEFERYHDNGGNCDCEEMGDVIATATGADDVFMKNLTDKMEEMKEMDEKLDILINGTGNNATQSCDDRSVAPAAADIILHDGDDNVHDADILILK